MSGTLYVVATPIGNLEDITLRALRILREVAVIAAEDTRRTAKLLRHHGIATPTISFHEHNTHTRLPGMIARLQQGESVALVSDAGTPLLSDPGLELIRACIDNRIEVDPVPGASAPLAALVASGFAIQPVTLLSFPPTKANARKHWFEALGATPHTVVFFESPHRISTTLRQAIAYLGNRPLVVGRELTKIHQEFLRGTAQTLAERLNEPRGEFTLVVGPAIDAIEATPCNAEPAQIAAEFGQITKAGAMTRRQAIAELAKKHRLPAREIYRAVEAAKSGLS